MFTSTFRSRFCPTARDRDSSIQKPRRTKIGDSFRVATRKLDRPVNNKRIYQDFCGVPFYWPFVLAVGMVRDKPLQSAGHSIWRGSTGNGLPHCPSERARASRSEERRVGTEGGSV